MHLSLIETILYLICNLFSIYIIGIFLRIFFESNASNKRRLLRILCYTLFFSVSSASFLIFKWNPNITLLITILGTVAVTMTYKGMWKYRFFSVIIIVATQVICEDLSYYLLVKLSVNNMFVAGVVSAQLLSFMIALLIQKIVSSNRGEDIKLSEWVSVIIIPICSLFISSFVIADCSNKIAVIFGEISMLLINVLVFYLLDKIQRMYQKQLDIMILEQQNRVYEYQIMISKESEERIVAMNHDMKNHFIALNQLIVQRDCIKAKDYIDDLIKGLENKNRFVSTGNYLIDGFLNVKLQEASAIGAKIKTDICISKNISIKSKDISIILGNLLDNAIQALNSIESEKNDKVLNIIMKESPGRLFMNIENSHKEKLIKVDGIFKTTKKNEANHGIGLKNVNKVVDKYQGYMQVEDKGCIFSVELILFFQ